MSLFELSAVAFSVFVEHSLLPFPCHVAHWKALWLSAVTFLLSSVPWNGSRQLGICFMTRYFQSTAFLSIPICRTRCLISMPFTRRPSCVCCIWLPVMLREEYEYNCVSAPLGLVRLFLDMNSLLWVTNLVYLTLDCSFLSLQSYIRIPLVATVSKLCTKLYNSSEKNEKLICLLFN